MFEEKTEVKRKFGFYHHSMRSLSKQKMDEK